MTLTASVGDIDVSVGVYDFQSHDRIDAFRRVHDISTGRLRVRSASVAIEIFTFGSELIVRYGARVLWSGYVRGVYQFGPRFFDVECIGVGGYIEGASVHVSERVTTTSAVARQCFDGVTAVLPAGAEDQLVSEEVFVSDSTYLNGSAYAIDADGVALHDFDSELIYGYERSYDAMDVLSNVCTAEYGFAFVSPTGFLTFASRGSILAGRPLSRILLREANRHDREYVGDLASQVGLWLRERIDIVQGLVHGFTDLPVFPGERVYEIEPNFEGSRVYSLSEISVVFPAIDGVSIMPVYSEGALTIHVESSNSVAVLASYVDVIADGFIHGNKVFERRGTGVLGGGVVTLYADGLRREDVDDMLYLYSRKYVAGHKRTRSVTVGALAASEAHYDVWLADRLQFKAASDYHELYTVLAVDQQWSSGSGSLLRTFELEPWFSDVQTYVSENTFVSETEKVGV